MKRISLTSASALTTGFIATAAMACKALKVSFIVGSRTAFFSYAQCLAPLAGVYGGVTAALLTGIVRSSWDAFFSTASWSFVMHAHIPTTIAGLYAAWMLHQTPSRFQRLALAAIPVVCTLLFATHTIGSSALLYTSYWIIPFLSALIPHNNRFIHALAATFTAHAVGSTIWLFAFGLTAATWISLIPVVAVERLLFASGMYVTLRIIEYIRTTEFSVAFLSKPFAQSLSR